MHDNHWRRKEGGGTTTDDGIENTSVMDQLVCQLISDLRLNVPVVASSDSRCLGT